jgi:hypothetical protein
MITNYFTDRHQSVKYENKLSPLMAILLGVPQGSVLGPLTFFMFITNKRVKLPKEITVGSKLVNDKSEDIKVSVVDMFKILGVTIDNKLNFVEHCSNLKKIVNKKLYSIKRLFFLCTSVKIHFFKTFILPYFDYCLSLIIYFPLSAYQTLNNCFNRCLYKLFKFKP